MAYHTAFLEDISPLTQEVKEQEKEVDEANKLVTPISKHDSTQRENRIFEEMFKEVWEVVAPFST